MIMKETDHILYTEITELGRQAQGWKTDSAKNHVEVCGSVPETGIQSCKVFALHQRGRVKMRGCGCAVITHNFKSESSTCCLCFFSEEML